MWILNKSKIENLSGVFETGTDFTISNLYDDDIGVYAKGTATDGVADVVVISFTTNTLSTLALLNINSYTNSLNVWEKVDNDDGTYQKGDKLIDKVILETTSQKKAVFEFDAIENVIVEVSLTTHEAVVTIGELQCGHFIEYGATTNQIQETPIMDNTDYVELDNGSKHYFYNEHEQSIRNSYNFTLFFKDRSNKLAFQQFMSKTKRRNVLLKIANLQEYIKFGQIVNFDFTYQHYNDTTITFEEVI